MSCVIVAWPGSEMADVHLSARLDMSSHLLGRSKKRQRQARDLEAGKHHPGLNLVFFQLIAENRIDLT